MKKRKTPTFEEAYKNTMECARGFETAMSALSMMDPMLQAECEIKKGKRLKLDSVKMTSSNFILGVGHEKCGCPGIVSMIFRNGDWVCPSCNGWISEKSAKRIMKKDYDKMANMFSNLSIVIK